MLTNQATVREQIASAHEQGKQYSEIQDYKAAAAEFRQSLELALQEGIPLVIRHCQWHLASALSRQGLLREALAELLPLLDDFADGIEPGEDYLSSDIDIHSVRFMALFELIQIGRIYPLAVDVMEQAFTGMSKAALYCEPVCDAALGLFQPRCLIEWARCEEAYTLSRAILARHRKEDCAKALMRVVAEAAFAAGHIAPAETKIAAVAKKTGDDDAWVQEMRAKIALRQGKVEKALEHANNAIMYGYYTEQREDRLSVAGTTIACAKANSEPYLGRKALTIIVRHTNRTAVVERFQLWLALADWHIIMVKNGKQRHTSLAHKSLRHAQPLGQIIDSRRGHTGCAAELAERETELSACTMSNGRSRRRSSVMVCRTSHPFSGGASAGVSGTN